MVGDPLAERAGGATGQLLDAGGDVSRLAESGGPGVEEHGDGGARNSREGVAFGFGAGHFLKAERATEDFAEDLDLLRLGEGIRASENVVFSRVMVFEKDASAGGADVGFVDGSGRSFGVRPANDGGVGIRTELRRPPVERVGGEHARAEERPLDGGRLNEALDFGVEIGERVRLAEERMRSLVRRGEKDELPDAGGDVGNSGSGGGRGSGPDEEDGVGVGEGGVERGRVGEIALEELDVGGEIGGFRVAGESA